MKGELRHVWPVEQIEAHAERLLEQLIVPHPDEELVGYINPDGSGIGDWVEWNPER